jgi:prepilin-type N-terminal cleavage/methylation domain-containing protein
MYRKSDITRGFTLIELLVVISIIGLLSSVVLASVNSARDKATAVKVVSEMKALQNAIEMYMTDHNGDVPPTGEYHYYGIGLRNLLNNYLVPNYISSISLGLNYNDNTHLYWYTTQDFSYAGAKCGGVPIENYIIFFTDWTEYLYDDAGRFHINLPSYSETGYNGDYVWPGSYCISG